MNAAGSKGGAVAKRRQTQNDRSAATREKLLDATYRILRDLGHAGLRSAKVSEESGVSRGGLLHHYPTQEELVAATFERLVEGMEDDSLDRVAAARDDSTVLEAIVADARARFLSDSYRVLLDILVASGKEKPIVEVRKAMVGREEAAALDAWSARLAATGVDAATAERVASMLWHMMKGIAVRNIVRKDEELARHIVDLGLKLARKRCAEAAGQV